MDDLQFTSDPHSALCADLAEVVRKLFNITDVEQLAAIHGKFQELVSNSPPCAPITKELVIYTLDLAEDMIAGKYEGSCAAVGNRTRSEVRADAIMALFLYSAQEWQTIDTCPDDGRMVWVFGGRHLVPEQRAADGAYFQWAKECTVIPMIPTHWHPMTIPQPPVTPTPKGTQK